MKTHSVVVSFLIIGGLFAVSILGQEETVAGEADTVAVAVEEPAADPVEDEKAQDAVVVLMDSAWAELACEAWNENPDLTDKLAAPGWVANNGDRGYKVIQMYRTDCENSPWVEIHIADQDEKAICIYGGPVQTEELINGVDYIMHAQTQRWQEMGAGNYGPMKGMMTGRLKFKGPKWEAMKNMGPFTSFLQLAGEVASDASACPGEAVG